MNANIFAAGGSGRSGSTLIGEVLAASTNRVMLGEVAMVWRALKDNLLCGCGEPIQTCPFWAQILERHNPVTDGSVDILYDQFRELMQTSLRPQRRRPETPEWDLAQASLLDTLNEVCPQGYVDTSKQSPHLAVVASHIGSKSKFVHITRDPRAVAFSWSVSKPVPQEGGTALRTMGPSKSSAVWVLHHRAQRNLEKYFAYSTRTSYESFAANPRVWVQRTLAQINESVKDEGVVRQLEGRAFKPHPGHTVAGNPGRFQSGPTRIEPDRRWETEQSRLERALSWSVAAVEARHYGLRWRPRTR